MTPGLRSETEGRAGLVLCPLCQDECQGLPSLEGHLAKAHKVKPEGMQKLLNMVEIPSAVLPTSGATDQGEAGTSDARSGSGQPSVAATSSSAMTSSGVTLEEAMELDVERLEEEHNQMVQDKGQSVCLFFFLVRSCLSLFLGPSS